VVTGAVFKAAVRDRRLAVNPCLGVKAPEIHKGRVEVITTEQVLILEGTIPPQWRATVMLGAGAGLRQGEALGVTRDRVDLLRRRLTVDRQLLSLPREEPRLMPVKTKASVRTIPLPPVVLDALSTQLASGDAPYGEAGLVFPRWRASSPPIWRATVRRAHLPDAITFRSIRH
jgi:integrase